MNKIILLGAGGHCASVLDSIISQGEYKKENIAILDNNLNTQLPYGLKVSGDDTLLGSLFSQGYKNAFVTVGSVGDSSVRRKLYDKLVLMGFNIPNIVDPSAIVSQESTIEKGVFVGKRAVINTRAVIKNNAIINTGAIIEHDCIIDQFVHVSPGAVLCGGVYVGTNSHVGAGATVKQQIRIGCDCIVGAGSVVVKNIPDNELVYGCPAIRAELNEDKKNG